ncbi:MAG TPA: cytochrome b N-terminal domain-containing protein [Candidatus Saccharimonadales bacterium]|nr:cytochrome b N-terminal domain-containing protein [Candidatus Saccharimonadales bacterium]
MSDDGAPVTIDSTVTAPQSVADDETGWTASVRRRVEKTLPITELLPTKQPAYIGSWVYVFGVVTIAALFWLVISGVVLAFFGSAWWHVSSVGHFFNSTHFWSVQMFFIFMVLHLWGQFWGAGWRDGRAKTWMVGVVIFSISVGTAFTGYVIQQNFDSQWIAINAKDAINSTGFGGLFNALNFGQMYGLHVMLMPIGVTLLVVLHIIQVRAKGVVRPIDDPFQVTP